jgi:hypothetical protein
VYRGVSLEQVDPEDGKEGVGHCTLVADIPPPVLGPAQ